jgi:hypothetical protein
MVGLLVNQRFDELAKSVSNKVADLLECETITALIGHAGERTVQMYLEVEIVKLAANFNGNPALNVKDYQVPIIAEMLIQNYKWESLEDFTLCFRRASCGFYGEIYRIDGAVIGGWMARYLDEKYDALEQAKQKEKKQQTEAQRAFQAVDGSKYIQQMLDSIGPVKQPEKDNSKENDFQRDKVFNPPMSTNEEQIRQKLLHIEYLKQNYDARTGQPLPGYLTEKEWNEKQK